MRAISLYPGTWTGALGLLFGGGVEVIGAGDEQQWLRYLGWAAVALGVAVLIWGVRIRGMHLWMPWWRKSGVDEASENSTHPLIEIGDVKEVTAKRNKASTTRTFLKHAKGDKTDVSDNDFR